MIPQGMTSFRNESRPCGVKAWDPMVYVSVMDRIPHAGFTGGAQGMAVCFLAIASRSAQLKPM
jgi:hypothetical protein